MNKKTFKVAKGYSELDYSERSEIRKFIEEYEKKKIDDRPLLIKSLTESLGPLSSGICPCCGK